MTQPTIGRVVHYVSYGTPGGEYPKTCRAAIVTRAGRPTAIDPTNIGLVVLNPTGLFFDEAITQDETNRSGGTWHWPCIITQEETE